MIYPTLEQYQEVLQHPSTALADSILASGSIQMTGLGLPLAMCGGFALTYTITNSGKKYAVRCFHKKSNALEARYQAISKKLSSLKSNYFVEFEFQSKGVRVSNQEFPIVKMTWAKGETFGEFIEENYQDNVKLQAVSKAFRDIALYLDSQNIAHGDIQSGNVMVSANGSSIQLIDYDGMYVEEIKNLNSAEIGHRSFQHPKRLGQHFNPQLDRFSLITLNLSLRVLQSEPELWIKTQSEAESILFRPNDYADPSTSSLFAHLFAKPTLEKDAKNFASICKSPFEKVPSLEDFIAGRNIPQQIIIINTAKSNTSVHQYISQYPVLSAKSYSDLSRHVGQVVELIGQIVEVKENVTKRSKRPYLFINFGDWRGNCVKIAIWSDMLLKMTNIPNESWKRQWISITGLVDTPYHGRKYGYTHISITMTSSNQIHKILEREAQYRLGIKLAVKNENSLRNREIIATLKEIDNRELAFHNSSSRHPISNNQIIVDTMRKVRSSSAMTISQSPSQRQAPPQHTVIQAPVASSEKDKTCWSCWYWLIGVFVLLCLLFFLK